jgi:hypothetical protein
MRTYPYRRPSGQDRRVEKARGSLRTNCLLAKRIMIAFDDETFDEIADRAQAANHSFNAEVRELVEIGLETIKQSANELQITHELQIMR